ncbi:MAG: menaquinone biosynthesis protein [Bacteroidetes bacterium]|nr:menaquinone biosynthesis protein [Bacteroidota bacterium]
MNDNNPQLKASAVEFLNTKPLIYGLESNRLPHRFDLTYDPPHVCAQKLERGEVDLGLIPSIEYSRIKDRKRLCIVPDVGVVSNGDVTSVLLAFNKSIEKISRVAVDSNSRTSVALLKIILREKYNTEAEFVSLKADLNQMLRAADAALVIGDYALEVAPQVEGKLDLGDEWSDMTDGLPFVYSFWAGTPEGCQFSDLSLLAESRNMGLAAVSEIADEYSKTHLHDASFYKKYLQENISYRLGESELEGLIEFYNYCFYYGIIGGMPEITFYGDPIIKGQ